MKDQSKNIKSRKNIKNEAGGKVILLCLLAAVPLIVMGRRYHTGLENYLWHGGEEAYDFFFFYKMWAVILLAAMMIIILAMQIKAGRLRVKFTRREWMVFIPLFAFVLLTFVSTLVSEHIAEGMWGGYEQFESVWAVMGYVVIAFYGFVYLDTEKASVLLLRVLAFVSGIIGLLGTLQFFGLDYCKSGLMRAILSASVHEQDINVVLEEGRVYSTLYNPNYVGVYCVLTIPVFVCMLLEVKSIKEKLCYGVVTVLLLMSLIGSKSKTGIIVLAVMLVIMLVFKRQMMLKKKSTLFIFAGVFAVFIGILATRGKTVLDTIKGGLFVEKAETVGWDAMRTTDDGVELCYGGRWFRLSLNLNTTEPTQLLTAIYEDGSPCEVSNTGDGNAAVTVNLKDGTPAGFAVSYGYITENDLGFMVQGGGGNFPFIYKNGTYQYYKNEAKQGKIDTTKAPRPEFLKGYEGLFSGRGYIWRMTMPLLPEHIFLGSGQGTFVFEFPNYDLAQRTKYGYGRILITKPHNLYLQTACQSGVFAMLLCVFAWGYYLIQAVRNNWREGLMSFASVGVMIGILGYLLMGFLNDSCIAVAPVFWLLLGLGVRQNYEARKKEASMQTEVEG